MRRRPVLNAGFGEVARPAAIGLPSYMLLVLLAILAGAVLGVASRTGPARAQDAAEAAPPPVRVALLVSSRADRCFDNGYNAAIAKLVARERDRINGNGGIAGRRLEVALFDDRSTERGAIANMRKVLADRETVAVVGLSSSNRARATFKELGQEIGKSGVPFLSHISVSEIFKPYENVYTTQASQEDERLPVMVEFIRHMKFQRIGFLGRSDAVYSAAIGDGLKKLLGDEMAIDQRVARAGEGLDAAELETAIAAITAANPDFLVVAVGTSRTAAVITQLQKAGMAPGLFVSGRLSALPRDVIDGYPNAMYELDWGAPPESDNDRLRGVISASEPGAWIFEGAKMAEAPGWAEGSCKAREGEEIRNPMETDNLRAIAVGARYADMVGLIGQSLRTAKSGTDIAKLRRDVLEKLETGYAAGRGVFRGTFENWSFQRGSRSAVRTPNIVIHPQGLGRAQLAPVQFFHRTGGGFSKMDTLYADIDLIRAHRIDDNDKMFSADFYMSMRSAGLASIDEIEFTNAALDPRTRGRQLTIEQLHDGAPGGVYPEGMKIYKVSGRFAFEPDLAEYPFDTQRFAIDFQPKRADRPFVVQAPPLELRDKEVLTDGWTVSSQYVGYSEEFVPLLDAFTHQASVVPFQKASFVWMMKRQTTDYYLRVVVPLGFILIVAYLSYFISTSHFEAIVTIQVTALLSAVALYLSLPELDADSATLSDRIFVLNYLVVSVMIVISILRVNPFVASRGGMKVVLGFAHIVVIPAMMLAIAIYVLRVVTL